jgi:hypothetical protein
MSLALNRSGTTPDLEVKTFGFDNPAMVHLGRYEIRIEDFLDAAFYVLVNTDLKQGDYRQTFLTAVRELEEVQGYAAGNYPTPILDSKRLARKPK